MKMVNVWFYKSDTDRIAAMFVIHLEGYLADSIKRQLRPLLQYPVCHYSATTLVAVGQNWRRSNGRRQGASLGQEYRDSR